MYTNCAFTLNSYYYMNIKEFTMNIKTTVPCIILSVAFLCWAENISIKGTVEDTAGNPVAGAKLRLTNYSHITTTSIADGSFILAGDTITASIPQTQKVPYSFNLILNKHKIVLVNNEYFPSLTVTMFNSRGRKVFSHPFFNLSAGTHTLTLNNVPFAHGLYFIQIHHKGNVFRNMKVCILSDQKYSCTPTPHASPKLYSSMQILQKTELETSDTCIVSSAGFKHKRILITNYIQDGIECVLTESKPWKAENPLEYTKDMVKIYAKGYDFEMGQPDPDIWGMGTSVRELPMHTVSFTYDFWMDTLEVSQLKYDELMKKSYTNYEQPWWVDGIGLGDNYACYLIFEYDAMLYCNARSKQDGYDTVYSYDSIAGNPGFLCSFIGEHTDMNKNGYRLPTEAEWEYACRAGSATDYSWNKDFNPYPVSADDTTEIGTWSVWSANSSLLDTTTDYGVHPVGTKKPNAYGLYDMHGNVSEYCNDFDEYYPYEFEVTDPVGSPTGTARILRGGNWSSYASHLRCANRYFVTIDYPYYFVGFRTVRTVE